MISITKLRTELIKNGFSDVVIKSSDSPGIAFMITAPFLANKDITNIIIAKSGNLTIHREEYTNFITISPKTLQLLTLLNHVKSRKDI